MEKGQSQTALETAKDTIRTTRKVPLKQSATREVRRAGTEFAQESAAQVWGNFMNQSIRTAALVEGLFEKFTDEILRAERLTWDIPPAVYHNAEFRKDFEAMRNTGDFVELIQRHGYQYALNKHQAMNLGNEMKIKRKRMDRIVGIIQELEAQLNKLCQQARVDGFDGKQ